MKVSKILGGVIVIAVILFVVYKLVNTTPKEDLPLNERVVTVLEDGGCLSCHSANPKLPFYANFPFAKDVIKADIDLGYKFYDIEKVMTDIKAGKVPNIVDITRIKRTIDNETMPPAKYYLVHWGSSITSKKAEIIEKYYGEQIAQMHKSFGALTAENMLNEPIIPLPDSISVDPRKVILGNILYHDGRLSKDSTISCASCHDLATGGVDNKQFSEGVNKMVGGVNAPTVYNAYYNFVQFWDGRAATLALQAAGPPLNPIEMACESFDEIVARFNEDKAFKTAFEQVYPQGISEATITDAIAEFEKTLITPNCRFDKYLKGDSSAINAEELEGYNLFKEYGCATCHSGIILGGQTFELNGLFKDYFADRIQDKNTATSTIPAGPDGPGMPLTVEDNGRFKETSLEKDRHRFKVPGLRNIALTAPYFHDGTKKTLAEAIRYMAEYQNDVILSLEETAKIEKFLNTLTGEYKGVLLTTSK